MSYTRQFFLHRPMVIFDFDGTLAALSPNRNEVQLKPLTRALVSRLSQFLPVGVVSGRELSDLKKRLHGLDRLALVGNHGAELVEENDGVSREQSERAILAVSAFLSALDCLSIVRDLPRSVIENKKLSITFHWRGLDLITAKKASQMIQQMALDRGGFRLVPGIESLSLVPRGLSDKGDAALRLLESAHARHLVYLGDEDTDEDVFVKARGERFMGIRVGPSAPSAAEWFVSEQSEVDRLLEVFLALVAGPTAAMPFMA
ncbi:MAG: trehalose-phosphatase [Bdellovibrionales bacterium]|nr:trehalose-phosphatase [Bdellovibrionales bacterium]